MGKLVDQSLVTVKPLAYYKMLLHVLRFGSKYLDPYQYKEVMGMLIGHLEGNDPIKNVIIEDAIPVSHGGSIEVKFTQEELGAFEVIDNQIFENYGDRNWFTVGWYHSHPGLNTFFSSTDIHNQLFWQSENNPSGIGLVFDHAYLERAGDLGFRA
ncbi:MAG: Mov34/MPN/PAD-1 family protein, partial [Candidatus Thorarchaeota archaeon]